MVTESRRRTSNLLVSKVTIDDAGNYTCAPSNAQADSVMVHVIEGNDLLLLIKDSIAENQSHLFSCKITLLVLVDDLETNCNFNNGHDFEPSINN